MLFFVVSVVRASFGTNSFSDTGVFNAVLALPGMAIAFSCSLAAFGLEFVVCPILKFSLDAGYDQGRLQIQWNSRCTAKTIQ